MIFNRENQARENKLKFSERYNYYDMEEGIMNKKALIIMN